MSEESTSPDEPAPDPDEGAPSASDGIDAPEPSLDEGEAPTGPVADPPVSDPDDGAEPPPEPSPAARAALDELHAIADRHWTTLPGDDGRTVPTTEEGLAAMEEALPRLAPLAGEHPDLAMTLATFARTCVWARRPRFVGTWATVIGAVAYVTAFLLAGKRSDPRWFAAALIWIGTVPLYVQAASSPQFVRTARLLSGHRTLDERLLAFAADGPPLVAPLWLLARAAIYGAVAPLLVLAEAPRRGRYLPGVVMGLVATVAGLWLITRPATIEPPEPQKVELPAAADLFAPSVSVGPTTVVFGEAPPESLPDDATLRIRAELDDDGGVRKVLVWVRDGDAGPGAAWGGHTREEDRSTAGCDAFIRDHERAGHTLRQRESRCEGDAWTVHEYELR